MTRKKILITGGSGYIGSNLITRLDTTVYEVHVISRKKITDLKSDQIKWHQIDILESSDIFHLLEQIRPNILIHLAWKIGHGLSHDSIENEKWLERSKNVIESFYVLGGEKAIISGTCAEYDWSYSFLSEYQTPLNPSMDYGKTKLELFNFVKDFCTKNNYIWSWPRIFFSFGPHQNMKSIVPSVINTMLTDGSLDTSDGQQRIDYLYIDDVVSGIILLMENDFVGEVNICSGHAIRLKDLINLITDKMDSKGGINFGKLDRSENSPKMILGDNRILKNMGWSQKVSLKKGIGLTIKHFKDLKNE